MFGTPKHGSTKSKDRITLEVNHHKKKWWVLLYDDKPLQEDGGSETNISKIAVGHPGSCYVINAVPNRHLELFFSEIAVCFKLHPRKSTCPLKKGYSILIGNTSSNH